jgi:hypothetical protein
MHTLPKTRLFFRAAYRALFSALTVQKFPDDLNHETFSMIYASLKLLLKETTGAKDKFFRNKFAKCLERHFADERKDRTSEVRLRRI